MNALLAAARLRRLVAMGGIAICMAVAACHPRGQSIGSAPEGARTSAGHWYSVRGNGPTIVLIHGANLDSRTFAPVANNLARDHRVVLADLRLHGRSVDDGARFSFVDDLRTVLDAAGVERATLVGHSLGAAIAIDLTLAHPERVEGLVLAGASLTGFAPTRPVPGLAAVAAAARQGDWPGVARELAASPVMRLYGDTAAASLMRTIVADNLALLRADPARLIASERPTAERLDQLRVPAVLVTGALDSTAASEVATFLSARMKDTRTVAVKSCGHIVPLDCPAPLIEAIRSLVARRTGVR